MGQGIKMVRGTTQQLKVTLKDANNQPYVLQSGEKVVFGVKKDYTDTDYFIKKIVSENIAGQAGIYIFTIDPIDTENMICGMYCYDVGLRCSNNFYNAIECSNFNLVHNITCRGACDD